MRFSRIRQLIGDEALQRLRDARVLVIGLGAVGSYTVEALARSGIGHLTLVDFDLINETNINRQLFALESTVGQFKHEIAALRVRDINPDCEVVSKRLFVDENNVDDLLESARWDYVMDAIDAVGPKCKLLKRLVERQETFLSSMGAACRTDPTKIKIGPLAEIYNCPLAAAVRKRLKKEKISVGFPCVYSTESVIIPKLPGAEELLPAIHPADIAPNLSDDQARQILPELESASAPIQASDFCINGEYQRGRTRRPLGSLPTLTGIFGLTAANEIILRLTQLEF